MMRELHIPEQVGGGQRSEVSPLFSGGGVHVEVRVGGGLLSTHWSVRACRGLGREEGEGERGRDGERGRSTLIALLRTIYVDGPS